MSSSTNNNNNNLPFKVDYAKSSRSKCHTTKQIIPAGTLRLGVMVPSRHYDGLQPNWHDAAAFMMAGRKRKRPASIADIDGFDNLNAEMDRGNRVKGESWHGIKIVGDFYSHKSIKKDGKPVSIIVVSNLEDARIQYDNYKAGGAQEYTDFIEKDVPDFTLTSDQEFILDNIRILQAALDNYGDPEWEVKGIDPGDFQYSNIQVFNRIGKLLASIPPDGHWDGTYNGKRLPSDDYWFTITVVDPDNISTTYTKHFSLLRNE